MKKFNIFLISVLGCLAAACSDPAGGNMSPDNEEVAGESGTMAGVTFAAASDDITVFAFRKEGNDYKYRKTFTGEWVADDLQENVYRRRAKISSGTYKFMFVKGYGQNLTLFPAAPGNDTDFGDIGFNLASDDGYYLSADELFLEKNPETIVPYDVHRTSIVSSTLSRAVSRIDVNLNRGYYDNGVYVGVPFEKGNSILDLFEGIELTINGAGTFVGLSGGQGSGTVKHSLQGSDYDEITDQGFARFTGPYIIPTGKEFDVKVALLPAQGSDYPVLVKDFTGNSLLRNEKLTLNLWVTESADDSEIIINITAETAPITDLSEGEAGMWD